MRCFSIFLFLLMAALTSDSLVLQAYEDDLAVRTSGSGSDSRSPSPSRTRGKTPAQEGHSTRLFGVEVSEGNKHKTHSTKLFGVNLTPGKPASPAHSSHSTHSHSTQEIHSPASHSSVQGQHPHHLSDARSANLAQLGKNPKNFRQRGEKKEPQEAWWKKKGGKPRATQGLGPRYEIQKKYREKQKIKKIGQFLAQPSFEHHRPPKGDNGPGSPGAGSHAVSRRRLRESEY